jgi:hypothetical protein
MESQVNLNYSRQTAHLLQGSVHAGVKSLKGRRKSIAYCGETIRPMSLVESFIDIHVTITHNLIEGEPLSHFLALRFLALAIPRVK